MGGGGSDDDDEAAFTAARIGGRCAPGAKAPHGHAARSATNKKSRRGTATIFRSSCGPRCLWDLRRSEERTDQSKSYSLQITDQSLSAHSRRKQSTESRSVACGGFSRLGLLQGSPHRSTAASSSMVRCSLAGSPVPLALWNQPPPEPCSCHATEPSCNQRPCPAEHRMSGTQWHLCSDIPHASACIPVPACMHRYSPA